MPNVRNVGDLFNQLDSGLVLTSRPVIERTEWGALSCPLTFKIYNRDYPRLDPCFDAEFGSNGVAVKRYPPPPLFKGADQRTDLDLSFLGAQSSRFTRNGSGIPGVGLLDVTYRGAVFAQPNVPLYENATARIAATTGLARGDVRRDADTGLYWSVSDNTVNAAASWGLVPIFTPPWKTSGRTRQSISVPIYAAGVLAGSAAVSYWAPEYTWRYVVYADFNNAAFIAPYNAGVDDPLIIDVQGFDADGNPVANPSLGVMIKSRAIHVETVACGRYFEVTETLQHIFTANPPATGVTGTGGDTLVAEGTKYVEQSTTFFDLIYPVASSFTLHRVILQAQASTGSCKIVRSRAGVETVLATVTLSTTAANVTSFAATDLVAGDSLFVRLLGDPIFVQDGPAPFGYPTGTWRTNTPPYRAIEWHVYHA